MTIEQYFTNMTKRQMSIMQQGQTNIVISFFHSFLAVLKTISGFNYLYYYQKNPATKFSHVIYVHQKKDIDQIAIFAQNLEAELVSIIDGKINGFVDDLTGFNMFWETITGDKDEYIAELWKKYFEKDIDIAIENHFADLYYRILDNQDEMIAELYGINANLFNPALNENLRKEFLAIFGQNLSHLSDDVNLAFGGELVALCAGAAAFAITTKLIKSNLVGLIVGLAVDYVVSDAASDYVDNKVTEDVKEDLSNAIKLLFYGTEEKDGFVDVVELNIENYHRAQKKHLYNLMMEELKPETYTVHVKDQVKEIKSYVAERI